MRTTRAYIASLGTTGLLVLSSVLVLAIGGTLFAFNSWPGATNGDVPESVVVETAGRTPAPDSGGPATLAARAAPAADEVASAALVPEAGGTTPPAGGTPGATVPDSGGTPPTPPGDDGEGTPAPPPPSSGPPETQPPSGGGGGGGGPTGGIPLPGGGSLLAPGGVSLTDGLADGVESTTDFLGEDLVGGPLGGLLTGAGDGLTDLVRGLDGTPPPAR